MARSIASRLNINQYLKYIKIRFYQHAETEFTLSIKKWYGWKPICLFDYGTIFNTYRRFKSKEDGLQHIKNTMETNPYNTRIVEYPTIIIH